MVPGTGDVLVLSYRPTRRFLRSEPIHESLMLEVEPSLADASIGPLRLVRAVYRSGSERIKYQATRIEGTVETVEVKADRVVLAATLTVVAPDLDVDGLGPHVLSGTFEVRRRSDSLGG
jgi:hypothetical protein